MLYSYWKRIIFIALILISFQNSIQSVVFTVDTVGKKNFHFSKGKGTYEFYIDGKLNDKNNTLNHNFTMDLGTSDGKKIKANCSPYNALGGNKFLCEIDKDQYPQNNVDILLPIKAPKVEKYTFKNWEQTIGANPGISNKISSETSKDNFVNTFITSSISVSGCVDEEVFFTVKGQWEKKDGFIFDEYFPFNIVLDNEDKDEAGCTYDNEPSPNFNCIVDGMGSIKFKEQIIEGLSNGTFRSFKVKGSDSGKYIENCSKINKILSSGTFNFLNKIIFLISLLLF